MTLKTILKTTIAAAAIGIGALSKAAPAATAANITGELQALVR